MDNLKQKIIWITLLAITLQLFALRVTTAFAANNMDVVINEIAWSGSLDSANDEWIELFNNTSQDIDLAGWTIEDDGTPITIDQGIIPARGYFLIEDHEDAVINKAADIIIGISLSNSGDSLVLKDHNSTTIDTVNSTGISWYAGSSTSNATMERNDPTLEADSPDNWSNAINGNLSFSSASSSILGTPGSVNSSFSGIGPLISISPNDSYGSIGDTVQFVVNAQTVTDFYSYGFDIIYDQSVLKFLSATELDFLGSDSVQTTFLASLENNSPGKLVIGSARLISPASGIDGGGDLFTMDFEVIGQNTDTTNIAFINSFVSDSIGDLPATYDPASFTVGQATIDPIKDLNITLGTEYYSLDLKWTPPSTGADSYVIQRKAPDGTFKTIGTSTEALYTDDDLTSPKANLIPSILYEYQVLAVKSGLYSTATTAQGTETRGILGDFDRSLRVDGKDLDILARSYGLSLESIDFNPLADSNYNAFIDGNDLIDLGINFGKST